MSRFVQPASDKLELTDGDWLIVKRRLTAGEQRRAFARAVKRMEVGQAAELDPSVVGLNKIVAYLLDWSLVDDQGRPVVIRDQPSAIVEAALEALDPASFSEIFQAISAHEAREAAALEQEKKLTATGSPFAVISRSAE